MRLVDHTGLFQAFLEDFEIARLQYTRIFLDLFIIRIYLELPRLVADNRNIAQSIGRREIHLRIRVRVIQIPAVISVSK